MSMIKYRVHEVAKDFNVPTKVISQILTDYATTPKNHMQVLETPELDVIFEYMTQNNQAASLEEIFTVKQPKEAPGAKQDAKKPAEQPKPGKPAPAPAAGGNKSAAQPAQNTQGTQNAQNAQSAKAAKPDKPHTPRQVAEKRVVEKHGGAAVNIEKYNEKFEDMAGMKAKDNNLRRGNKEKITSKAKQRTSQQLDPPRAARRSATI